MLVKRKESREQVVAQSLEELEHRLEILRNGSKLCRGKGRGFSVQQGLGLRGSLTTTAGS